MSTFILSVIIFGFSAWAIIDKSRVEATVKIATIAAQLSMNR